MGILKEVGKIFKMALVDNNPLFEAYNEDAKKRHERSEQQITGSRIRYKVISEVQD